MIQILKYELKKIGKKITIEMFWKVVLISYFVYSNNLIKASFLLIGNRMTWRRNSMLFEGLESFELVQNFIFITLVTSEEDFLT